MGWLKSFGGEKKKWPENMLPAPVLPTNDSKTSLMMCRLAAAMDAREVVATAWDEWLATDDHMYSCIGYSEGQLCCAEADEQTPNNVYRGRQATLLDLTFDALASAGFRLTAPDGTVTVGPRDTE